MRRISIILFCFFAVSTNYAENDKIFYISPGFGLSWDFSSSFVFTPKVSFGLYQNKTFYNITWGYSSASDNILYPFYFIECQFGKLTEPMEFQKMQLFYGLGLGIAIHSNNLDQKFSYKTSLFTGFGAFVNASFLYNDKFYSDLGVETVLPVPLSKFEFGSPGGIK